MKSSEEIFKIVEAVKPKVNNLLRYDLKPWRKLQEKYKKHEIKTLILLSIETPRQLCKLLESTFFDLGKLINNPIYRSFHIPKKKGGFREISAPAKDLRKVQKKLNYYLQAYYLCIKPEDVHGFVINPRYLGKYCNIVANAKVHTGKKYVLNIDLKDFFPSISARQVKEVLSSDVFRFNDQISTALALITTFEGRLPTGSPTSPVISNFICLKLDDDLKCFSNNNDLNYTRYADDLTFSSDFKIDIDIILDIVNVIKKHNFSINEKKLRLSTSSQKQTVTGLTVNEKVNVDRKLLKKIRAMLFDFSANGLDSATERHFKTTGEIDLELKKSFVMRLKGYINFVGQVRGKNDELFKSFSNQLHYLLAISEVL